MPVILRPSGRVLHERQWDEESVVFDAYSAETHYLNALASAILRRVTASGALDLDALCVGEGTGAFAPEEIGAAAGRLRDIGLLRIDETSG